jgi:hypothetical protein
LGFYWLSTGKSRSNETNGVASTTGFAEASSRTGRRGKAPGEVLPAALHIRGETFSATRHVVEPKLHLTATADQTPSAGRLVPAGKPTLFQRKKEKDSLHENTRRHRGDELRFQSPRRRPSCRPRRRSPATRRLPRLLLPSSVLSAVLPTVLPDRLPRRLLSRSLLFLYHVLLLFDKIYFPFCRWMVVVITVMPNMK